MTTERLFDEEVEVTDAVIRVLEEAGIDTVFGIPGGYTVKFYDAMYDHTSSVRAVLVREESLAGVMAEAYGRLTGKPAVVMGQGAFLLSQCPDGDDRRAPCQHADALAHRLHGRRALLPPWPVPDRHR